MTRIPAAALLFACGLSTFAVSAHAQSALSKEKDAENVGALIRRLATKPSAEQILCNARAKSKVIRHPDPQRVVSISDQTFFASIDPRYPGMELIVESAKRKDYEAAWRAFDAYLRKHMKPVGAVEAVEALRRNSSGRNRASTDPRADKICKHVIRTYYHDFDLGPEIDWTKGKEYPQAFHGLHFWGWSARLWTAYLRTGNEKYVVAADKLFSSWYAQRAAVAGATRSGLIIWYELGCGARTPYLLQLYYAMKDSETLPMQTRKLFLKTFLGHANQLHAMEQCGYTDRPAPANFQLTASKSLYQLGLAFPMFRDSARWRETGTTRLLEHAYWDFDKEGGHNERCFGYGHISMKAVRQLLVCAKDDPSPSPLLDELRKRVLQMQLWFLKYVAPDGVFTGVNDSKFCRIPSVLVDLARFAHDGRILWPIRDSNRLPKGIAPIRPEFLSVHMPDGGWTFMRDGWHKESFYLQINWGPYGGGHTHPALLDINAFAFGEPMVIEAGRFGSYDNPLEPYFRSPEAHNQVTVVGYEFDRKSHRGENAVWRSQEKLDYFEATHRGYEHSAGKILTRQVLFLKGEYWLVVDTVLNASDRAREAGTAPMAVLNWHAPYKWRRTEAGLVGGKDGGPGVQLIVWPRGEPKFQTGYEDTIEMYKSRYRAYYTQPAVNGARFVTLIVPYKRRPARCKLEMLEATEGCVAVRVVREGVSDRIVFTKGNETSITAGDVETDARVVWLRERPRAAVVVDGTRLTFDNRPVVVPK